MDTLNNTFQSISDINSIIIEQPPVEAIPKADYETRLKSDMVAMLEEISLEIEEKTKDPALDDYDCGFNTGIYVSRDIIQQKIDKLKENTDGLDL